MRESNWNRPWPVSQSLLESTFVWWKTLFHLIPGRTYACLKNWKLFFSWCCMCAQERNGHVPSHLWHIDVPTWIPLQFPPQIPVQICAAINSFFVPASGKRALLKARSLDAETSPKSGRIVVQRCHHGRGFHTMQNKTLDYAFHTCHAYTNTEKQQTTNPNWSSIKEQCCENEPHIHTTTRLNKMRWNWM